MLNTVLGQPADMTTERSLAAHVRAQFDEEHTTISPVDNPVEQVYIESELSVQQILNRLPADVQPTATGIESTAKYQFGTLEWA